MKNITKEQYIEALNIVCKYHEQLKVDIQIAKNNDRVLIKDFLLAIKFVGNRRVYNIVNCVNGVIEHTDYKGEKYKSGYEYLDELTDSNFLKIRNAGKNSLREFKKLKDLFNDGSLIN
jgi:hypothetical protein